MSEPADPNDPKVKRAKARKDAENKQLTAQTRKILGKHYANKYRTRRG
jgi:capsule polysaccharide export protein KpsE/RkpR